ncbi:MULTISPECIES: hypothetical protein [unclassified Flavobacterium]|uniref:hypothetical protein n=1 Tax=unclassified Flavobacterium TaxID=196869 RepID=UPI003F8E3FA5
MKKNNYIYSLFVLFLLTLVSCSGEKSNSEKLIKRLVETTEDGQKSSSTFSYDDNKIVNIDGVDSKTSYSYTDELITKKVVFDNKKQLSITTDYLYQKGNLVSAKEANSVIKYTYAADHVVEYQKFTKAADGKEIKEFHGKLVFKNGNLVEEERVLDNSEAGVIEKYTYTFEYDDKINPMQSVMGYDKLLDRGAAVSKNNSMISTRSIVRTQDNQSTSSANFYSYAYKYDEEGYPIENVSEAIMPANGKSGYLKTEFFYM